MLLDAWVRTGRDRSVEKRKVMETSVAEAQVIDTHLYPYTVTGILSTSELTLGSYLHFLHIPLTGQLMSLNQCFWLNVSKNWSPDHSTLKISCQVALIKMMSPVGKRLTPMIAIAMQGLLFEIGCLCFGSNVLGRSVGSVLMSFWSFFQSFLIYVLLLGGSLFQMADFFSEKVGIDLYTAMTWAVLAKAGVAILVSVLSHVLSRPLIEQYGSWIQKLEANLRPKKSLCSRWRRFFRSPIFYSMAMATVYLYYTVESTELFMRQALFYCCWIVAISYSLDFVQAKVRFAVKGVE